jgi:hypothetical protein
MKSPRTSSALIALSAMSLFVAAAPVQAAAGTGAHADGSAAAYARWLQGHLRPAVFPAAPLFVADPAMNAIVVYDSTLVGAVAPNSVWPANVGNRLNVPVAVTTGLDCIPACGKYLWVSNVGNATVTAYAIPLTGAPAFVRRFRAATTCPTTISRAFGIAHAKGRLYLTNEGSNSIAVFRSNANGPSCPFKLISGSSTTLAAPRGPSVSFPTNANVEYVFNANANAGTVTGFKQNATGNVPPVLLWNTAGAITDGTATDWNLKYLWLTTSANAPWPMDALWLCTPLPLPVSCPTSPTIFGGATALNSPQLPSVSTALGTVFAPNQNGGTVTEYPESGSGNVPPVATFTGLVNPVGTAIENAPD